MVSASSSSPSLRVGRVERLVAVGCNDGTEQVSPPKQNLGSASEVQVPPPDQNLMSGGLVPELKIHRGSERKEVGKVEGVFIEMPLVAGNLSPRLRMGQEAVLNFSLL